MAAIAGKMKTVTKHAKPRSKDRRDAKRIVDSILKSSGRTQCSQFDRLGAKEAEKAVVEVMHSVQVVAKHIVGILSGHEDSLQVREQERKLGRFGIQSRQKAGEKKLPPAPFTLTSSEKITADKTMATVRVPRDAGVLPTTLFTSFHGMKSHTWYLLMTQGILVYMMRNMLGEAQRQAVTHLCTTLMLCCTKELPVSHLRQLDRRMHKSLALMERDFPVSIQTILMHTLHHLPACLEAYGPVRSYWMFPYERQIHTNIINIHNRRSPEGAAVEAHKIDVVCELLEGAGVVDFSIINGHKATVRQHADVLCKEDRRWLLNAYLQLYPQLAAARDHLYREFRATNSTEAFSNWSPKRRLSPVEQQLINGPSDEIQKVHEYEVNGHTYFGEESFNNPSVISLRTFDNTLHFGFIKSVVSHQFLGKVHIFAHAHWLRNPVLVRETEQFVCDMDDVEESLNPFVCQANLSVPLITAIEERSLHILNFMDAVRFSELLVE